MKNILISAYACNPSKGSEDSYGFHWASGIQKAGNKVICMTRYRGKCEIIKQTTHEDLIFEYLDLPLGLEKLYGFSRLTLYLHYIIWQWFAYLKAKKLHAKIKFDIVHHVTWGSLQLGSFMYLLNIPFIFGPAGGGQFAPKKFKNYFKDYWNVEEYRIIISYVPIYINPGFKKKIYFTSVF
jgi:hypothetical protein